MAKKFRGILPEYVYEIMMDIIKSQGLDKREELISERLDNATDLEVIDSLMKEQPTLALASIAKKAAIEKLSEKEIASLIGERLRLEEKRAESLALELKKKLIFFIEVIEVDAEKSNEKEILQKENESFEEEKKESEIKETKKVNEKENQDPDPYREPIE